MVGIPVVVGVPQFENPFSIAHVNKADFSTFSKYSLDFPRAGSSASWLRIVCSKRYSAECHVYRRGAIKESYVKAQMCVCVCVCVCMYTHIYIYIYISVLCWGDVRRLGFLLLLLLLLLLSFPAEFTARKPTVLMTPSCNE